MCEENKNHFAPKQFSNKDNIECHERTTAREIMAGTLFRKIDAFVSGAGTGGTIMGVQKGVSKILSRYKDRFNATSRASKRTWNSRC